MALKDAKKEIETFIKSSTPQVLALSGAWGTGKTFLWKELIKEHRDCKAFQKYKYAYISASNCQNINELKTSILALSGWEKTKKYLPQFSIRGFPVSDILKSGLGALAEGGTKNSLICIDDIERASDNINPYEILNYASYLRDEGNCKIVLLFNADQIDSENKEKFKRTIEKGVDQFLKLNLTPKEAGGIFKEIIAEKKKHLSEEEKEKIFPEKWTESFLEITIELGICNIRVLEHLATALNRWYPIIKGHEKPPETYKELLNSIFLGTIITGWGHFEPDFCLEWKEYLILQKKKNGTYCKKG